MNRQQHGAVERWLLMEEILSQLRHPLRNKLASIRNAVFFIGRSLQKSGMPTDPRVPAFLSMINDELTAAERQVTSGIGRGGERGAVRSRVQVSECIARALQLRPLPAEVATTVDCAADRELGLFAEDVVVALGCLLDNACEAVAGAGQIGIVTSAQGGSIAITVSDSGSGFSPEAAERAFEAFYSTKPGHVGLGLNLASRIAQEHDGRLIREPVVTGARLTMLLPCTLAAPDAQPGAEESS